MGQNQSQHEGGPRQSQKGRASGSKKQLGISKGATLGQEEAPDTLKLDKDYDIVIMATPEDRTLVQHIQRELETLNCSVYTETADSEEKYLLMEQAVTNSQLVVVVISKYTADCKECQKLFSLCYVSDKPIVSAATNNKEELLDKLTVAMRLDLKEQPWFEMDLTQPGTTFDDFKAEVMAKLQHTTDGEAEPVVEARAPVKATHPVDEPSLAESQPKKGEGPSSVHVTTTENGDLYKGPMRQWNQDALISLQEDLTVNVNVNDSGMINHLTKLPTISSEKPSIGILSRRETMVVEKTKEMDQMSKIIGMLLGKEDDAFQNFCMILEICGAGVWSGRLKERARAFKKANEEDCQQADKINGAPLPSTHKPNGT